MIYSVTSAISSLRGCLPWGGDQSQAHQKSRGASWRMSSAHKYRERLGYRCGVSITPMTAGATPTSSTLALDLEARESCELGCEGNEAHDDSVARRASSAKGYLEKTNVIGGARKNSGWFNGTPRGRCKRESARKPATSM